MSHWRPARLLRGGNGGREGARGGSFRETGGAEELLSAGPEPPPGGEAQEKLARRHGRRRLRVCAYCLRSNLRTSEGWRSPAPTATGGGGGTATMESACCARKGRNRVTWRDGGSSRSSGTLGCCSLGPGPACAQVWAVLGWTRPRHGSSAHQPLLCHFIVVKFFFISWIINRPKSPFS